MTSMNDADRAWQNQVLELGCIVCHREGTDPAKAEIHHIRRGLGDLVDLSRVRDNYHILPLCPIHHRLGDCGTAIHAGIREWEEAHANEEYLFLEVLELIRDKQNDFNIIGN